MIKIVSNSSINLPQEIVDALDITLVPAYVVFGEEELRENVDISTGDVLARLEADHSFPMTSQPPPADFEAAYRAVLAKHPGATILSLHITGASSGTVSSALRAAAALPGADIRIFDTRAFSIAQALMVRQAALMASLGETSDVILARLADMRDRVQTFFVLDTLDYVYKGGRIGRAAHLVGSLLSIKPVLTVRDGVMKSYRALPHALAGHRRAAQSPVPRRGRCARPSGGYRLRRAQPRRAQAGRRVPRGARAGRAARHRGRRGAGGLHRAWRAGHHLVRAAVIRAWASSHIHRKSILMIQIVTDTTAGLPQENRRRVRHPGHPAVRALRRGNLPQLA